MFFLYFLVIVVWHNCQNTAWKVKKLKFVSSFVTFLKWLIYISIYVISMFIYILTIIATIYFIEEDSSTFCNCGFLTGRAQREICCIDMIWEFFFVFTQAIMCKEYVVIFHFVTNAQLHSPIYSVIFDLLS